MTFNGVIREIAEPGIVKEGFFGVQALTRIKAGKPGHALHVGCDVAFNKIQPHIAVIAHYPCVELTCYRYFLETQPAGGIKDGAGWA